jgi:acyl carrier protein
VYHLNRIEKKGKQVTREKLIEIVRKSLELLGENNAEVVDLQEYSWDSLGHLRIIIGIENELRNEGKSLTIDLSESTNFNKLENILKENKLIS